MELPIHVDDKGNHWKLANIPAPLMRSHRIYGDEGTNTRLVPWAEIDERINSMGDGFYSNFISPLHDQNGYGMCVASTTASAIESAHLQAGEPLVKLSGGDLYGRINGGVDQGALLEDALTEAENGIAEVSECPYLEWRRRVAGITRKNHRLLEYFLAPTFHHCISGVTDGFQLITGIMWYDNYMPDSDAWLPKPSGRGGGHAIHGFRPAKRGSTYGIRHKNSWGNWGRFNGFFVIPQSAYSGQVGGWWLVRSVTSNATDQLPKPQF